MSNSSAALRASEKPSVTAAKMLPGDNDTTR
jgi:hypothetical protein